MPVVRIRQILRLVRCQHHAYLQHSIMRNKIEKLEIYYYYLLCPYIRICTRRLCIMIRTYISFAELKFSKNKRINIT